ncbi:MAG: NGG1p interacting factor NIF3 [Gammaproteobacteria bacterium]|nr:NGG1p interacting factor NIF3 [Gammaproteobacteria bacterium]
MYKIIIYIPVTHLEVIKNALFAAGAGNLGEYRACSWQVLGEGQFIPKAASSPFIGTAGQLEKVAEYKVEMICATEHIKAAIAELKRSHPYEEPAYQVIKLENF